MALIDQGGEQPPRRGGFPSPSADSAGYRLLGVTACPTGIAHTYMAAEGLLDKAKEMGISMKVETDGSGGVKTP